MTSPNDDTTRDAGGRSAAGRVDAQLDALQNRWEAVRQNVAELSHAGAEAWRAVEPDVRRLLTIAMLIALGREGELRLHLRSALEQGTPVETLKEVILQSAIYCGVPAANAAFHLASELVAEHEGGRNG